MSDQFGTTGTECKHVTKGVHCKICYPKPENKDEGFLAGEEPRLIETISREQIRGLSIVEFAKYDVVLKSSHGRISTDSLGYSLQVSWIDLFLLRKALKDRVKIMVHHTLGTKESGVIEIWCYFLYIRFSFRHYY